MATDDRRNVWIGFWATSLGTLASRVLGLLRDMATAGLLGLGEGGVMDAFVVAFRLPNLLRRIFGEGALATSFLPVFTAEFESHPRRAWQLTSVLFTWLAAGLALLTLAGEAVCGLMWSTGAITDATRELLILAAILLPYMIFICLAAQASAALQALGEFSLPAIAPALLNVCWLAAVWFVAPRFSSDKLTQAQVLAAAVLISGVLQFAAQLPALGRLGFRFDYDLSQSRAACAQVVRAMLPITLGMAVTQLNTLVDSLVAWGLSDKGGAQESIAWLGHMVSYPMQTGAVAAIYYGERFYQLPVGVLGMAIATVIYPLVSRHATRGDKQLLASDLTLGLRLVAFTALPAGVGIMLIAQPLTSVLFERGEFTSGDVARAARMIAAYASGVWAYCAIPVLVRGYYAAGDRLTPARLGLAAVGLNLALNLTLIWPLAEVGLAVSTAIAASVQVALLALGFSRSSRPLIWPALSASLIKSALATALMAVGVFVIGRWQPATTTTRFDQAFHLALVVLGGSAIYAATAWFLRMDELHLLAGRKKAE